MIMNQIGTSLLVLGCSLASAFAQTNSLQLPPIAVAPYILTPPAPASPRINGANVFGVRPGSPFLFTIPATGERPMTFSVENLPDIYPCRGPYPSQG